MSTINKRALAKAATLEKVLAAGKAMFEEVGYEKATIRLISSRMGMSTGAVFSSVKDKAALYEMIYGHPPITPEVGQQMAWALRRAITFIEGFENDPLQKDVDVLLATARSALSDVFPAGGCGEMARPTEFVDPDDAPEWDETTFDRAAISLGGQEVRPATGTLTKAHI